MFVQFTVFACFWMIYFGQSIKFDIKSAQKGNCAKTNAAREIKIQAAFGNNW